MGSNRSKILYISVMALYGTTGILKRFVPFSSSFISFSRALIGSIFLLLFIYLTGKRLDRNAIKKNLDKLITVGILLAFNWVLFFEACEYTTVAKATLCYYMAPVIVLVLSPILYKEKLSTKKIVCIMLAFLGMVLVSGVLTDRGQSSAKGIIIGLLAAAVYASIVIVSRKITEVGPYDKTAVQLIVACVCLIPFVLLGNTGVDSKATTAQWIILAIIGVVNTGFAYVIYFGTMPKIKAQTIAIFAYADPVVSVILSALVLKEPLGVAGAIGAVLIIGAMLVSEI